MTTVNTSAVNKTADITNDEWELIAEAFRKSEQHDKFTSKRSTYDFDPENDNQDNPLGLWQQSMLIEQAIKDERRLNKQKKLRNNLSIVGKMLTVSTVFFAVGYAIIGNPSVAMIILSAYAGGLFYNSQRA